MFFLNALVKCCGYLNPNFGGILGGAQRGTYHGAKHGVIALTKSAALEYAAQGICINTVCPGLIHTAMADQMIAGGQKEALDAMLQQVPVGRHTINAAVCWYHAGIPGV